MKEKYRKIVNQASITAGIIGIPGTFSFSTDITALAVIWGAMMLSISSESGHPIDDNLAKKMATSVVASVGAYLAGGKVAAQILKMIPGPGSFTAIGINSILNVIYTYKLGSEFSNLFDRSDFGPQDVEYVVKSLTSLVVCLPSGDEIKEIITMIDPNEILKNGGGKTADQIFDDVQREAGVQAIQKITTNHVTDIGYIREHFPVNDLDLLSMRVTNLRNVPTDIKQRIAGFQARVRRVIDLVANEIEEHKYQKTENDITNMDISANEKLRVNTLVSAEKKLFISFESLKNTIELLSQVNVFILEKIDESERNKDEATERKMVLANALLVYELTDYVITYIETFSLQGLNDIKSINQNELKKLQELENQANDLRKRAESANSPQVRDATLEYADNIQNSVGIMRQEWNAYLAEISQLCNSIDSTRTMISDLKLMRDSASLQIDFISNALTLGILRKNYIALFDSVKGLETLKLVSLNPDRARRLFFGKK